MASEGAFQSFFEKFSKDPGVKESRMFGFKSLTVRGKTFALIDGDSMVFKLGGEALEEALGLDGASCWNPFGHEKKAWVKVPSTHAARWEEMAESSRAYVESLIIAA